MLTWCRKMQHELYVKDLEDMYRYKDEEDPRPGNNTAF